MCRVGRSSYIILLIILIILYKYIYYIIPPLFGGHHYVTQKLFFCNCNCKCKFLVHCIVRLPWWGSHCGSGVKSNCNVLVIIILYDGKVEGFECGFPCFLPEFDAIFHAGIIAKRIVLSPVSPNLGRITRPMNPISLPSTPQNSTSAPLVPLPGTLFPHTPNHHLGCPILPFGMSHFAFWGIPFHHLGYFKACLCPHIGAVLPSLCADFFPL